jgi:iron complex transport system substrate-binding protein
VKAAVLAPLLLAVGALAFSVAVVRRPRGIGFAGGRYLGTEVVGRAFPKELVSGANRTRIAAPPRRIASLTVTADEILTAIAEPERIAAVTHFADDPSIELGAARTPRAAARIWGIDPERLISLEPDIVFVAHYNLESAVRILASASIPVVRLHETRSYRDVDANVRLSAAAIGEEARGEALLERMHAELGRVKAAVAGRPAPRVLYYSQVGYTSGTGTLVDEKIRLAGGRNASAEAGIVGFTNVSLDLLVGLDPDVILVPRWTADPGPPVREVTGSVAFRDVAAVQHGRVYAVAASLLTSESPDGVAGIEIIARLLHPEAFPS